MLQLENEVEVRKEGCMQCGVTGLAWHRLRTYFSSSPEYAELIDQKLSRREYCARCSGLGYIATGVPKMVKAELVKSLWKDTFRRAVEKHMSIGEVIFCGGVQIHTHNRSDRHSEKLLLLTAEQLCITSTPAAPSDAEAKMGPFFISKEEQHYMHNNSTIINLEDIKNLCTVCNGAILHMILEQSDDIFTNGICTFFFQLPWEGLRMYTELMHLVKRTRQATASTKGEPSMSRIPLEHDILSENALRKTLRGYHDTSDFSIILFTPAYFYGDSLLQSLTSDTLSDEYCSTVQLYGLHFLALTSEGVFVILKADLGQWTRALYEDEEMYNFQNEILAGLEKQHANDRLNNSGDMRERLDVSRKFEEDVETMKREFYHSMSERRQHILTREVSIFSSAENLQAFNLYQLSEYAFSNSQSQGEVPLMTLGFGENSKIAGAADIRKKVYNETVNGLGIYVRSYSEKLLHFTFLDVESFHMWNEIIVSRASHLSRAQLRGYPKVSRRNKQ